MSGGFFTEFFHVKPEDEPTDEEIRESAIARFRRLGQRYPALFAEGHLEDWLRFDGLNHARAYLRTERGTPLATIPYEAGTVDLSDKHTHCMTVAEWKECCEDGGFIDDDGYGAVCKLIDGAIRLSLMTIQPSVRHLLPLDATHIDWYNR